MTVGKGMREDDCGERDDTMSFALWTASGSLSQRVDYLYAYYHRRFTT